MDDIIKTGIVELEKIENIGIFKLNNGSQNVIDELEFLDIGIFRQWIDTNNFIGLIISAKGRHFSSGVNIEYLKKLRSDTNCFRESLSKFHEILAFIESLPLITIAAIPGVCFGGGLEIALSCHFRFCSQNAVLAFPETNRNIMPGGAGTIRLPRVIGFQEAVKMIVSGNTISANKAKEMGLIDCITPKKKVIEYSIDFIKDLTKNKPDTVVRNVMLSLKNFKQLNKDQAVVNEIELFMGLVEEL